MLEKIDKDLKGYYEKNLTENGAGAKGVGWKNEQAQRIRFAQLGKLINPDEAFTLNDLGCGVGDFVQWLDEHHPVQYQYYGYDVLPEMINLAKEKFAGRTNCHFRTIRTAADLEEADYSIASGIFNLRYGASDAEWQRYILETIEQLNHKSRRGFAFNALTSYADPEYMQPHLYYSDPLVLFDHCKRKIAKDVALLHDYQQYDFTILVRKF